MAQPVKNNNDSNNDPTNNIKIMQWNARSLVSNKHSLSMFLKSEKIDIALISETWLKPNLTMTFTGYDLIRSDRINGKGGVAILVGSKLRYQILNFDGFKMKPEICGIKVYINNETYNIISIYRPPSLFMNSRAWSNIMSNFGSNLIIGGDFNAHSGLWGSPITNRDGNELLEAIECSNLIVLNDGSSTRLVPPNYQKSCVDVSLAATNIAPLIHWNLCSDTLGSDHFPIIMLLNKKVDVCRCYFWYFFCKYCF